jgi:guanylate kinase
MMTATSITPLSFPAPALKRRGIMLILASPPGGGKTTISREIRAVDPNTTISVSATTRSMRPGEAEGEHYYFITPEKFQDMIDHDEMLEYAMVYNHHLYGTPKAPIEKTLAQGRDVIFDIDWQGTRKLSETAKDDVVSVFLLPPSWAELEKRLHNRAREPEPEIIRRLGKAEEEISHYKEFQYVIVNTDLQESVRKVRAILEAERQRRARLMDLDHFVATLKPQP